MFSEKSEIKYKKFNIEKVLGNGASARVYRVNLDGKISALKIFDPAIFSGDVEAKERLHRQEKLVGVTHCDLASIFEIGEATIDEVPAPALLMEFCEGQSLENQELQASLTEANIRSIIAATTRAAKHLFELGFVHRDIKPANIVFDSTQNKAKLLDTGVIRPLQNVNDVSGFAFVGTTRYSPPEFLFRTETDSLDCWKAVTFYQLGITLYELVFRRQPYCDLRVKAQLIRAIESNEPSLDGIEHLPADLRYIIICSLKRDWQLRVKTLNWDNFLELETEKPNLNRINEAEVHQLTILAKDIPLPYQDALERLLQTIADEIRDTILDAGYLIRIQRNLTQVIIFVGKSDKNLRAVVTLTLTAGNNDTFVATLASHAIQSHVDYYLLSSADREQLREIVLARLAESI